MVQRVPSQRDRRPIGRTGQHQQDLRPSSRTVDSIDEVPRSVIADLVAALVRQGQYSVIDGDSNPSPICPNRPMFAFTGWLAGAPFGVAWAPVKRRQA